MPIVSAVPWLKRVESMTANEVAFGTAALQYNLASPAKLYLWGMTASDTCVSCGLRATESHILSNCPARLNSAKKGRHDSILMCIASWLRKHLRDATVWADIEDFRGAPPPAGWTKQRPDIQVARTFRKGGAMTNTLWVIELTVPSEANFAAAELRKSAKYEALITEYRSAYDSVKFTHIGIGTRGVILQDTDDEVRAGMRLCGAARTVGLAKLWEECSLAALRGSIVAWCAARQDVVEV